MKLPFSEPEPQGSERARIAKEIRNTATEDARLRAHALTLSNCEEQDYGDQFPANFTKGLLHDEYGIVKYPEDYRCLVEAINSPDPSLFDKGVESAETRGVTYSCSCKKTCGSQAKCDKKKPEICREKNPETGEEEIACEPGYACIAWRGWESPRGGHVYDLEGPDAGAVGMAPAPRVGSSELAAEMAEVYALAILRDVPFTEICVGGGSQICEKGDKDQAILSAAEVVRLLGEMSFYSGEDVVSSTPCNAGPDGFNSFERNRREARTNSLSGGLTTMNVFRGSTMGAMQGPYISQFMLIGANSLACQDNDLGGFPGLNAAFGLEDGLIPYGSLTIDQRTLTHKGCLDYMTDWCSWLDVQNGANLKGADLFEDKKRFITTPRDLATYVHFDALYEAYLNACLVMLAMNIPASKGFPEPSPTGRRDAFATFGGPHILSLVTEVATRCLKAVRRQKFNYHRRARPEAMGGRFTLSCLGLDEQLGCSRDAFKSSLKEIPDDLKKAIIKHNFAQNEPAMRAMRNIKCGKPDACLPKDFDPKKLQECNLLLPMAFPEGSPMHPAYGAGHATVAGGCVTMLKAFFEMFTDCDCNVERPLKNECGEPIVMVPNANGSRLVRDKKFKGCLTIQGELDKLAANIAIGRNMAGVHYYSDYYDSLRMGERVAVGILLEQAPTYGEQVESTFKSFDGDYITIAGSPGARPNLTVIDKEGNPVSPDTWWTRHVPGQQATDDA